MKIVQLTTGAMNVTFDIFEKSGIDESIRSNLYLNLLKFSPDPILVGQGGQFGVNYTGNPLPYCDRDEIDAERTFNLHCRLANEHGGTASDFQVSLKVGDMSEAG